MSGGKSFAMTGHYTRLENEPINTLIALLILIIYTISLLIYVVCYRGWRKEMDYFATTTQTVN